MNGEERPTQALSSRPQQPHHNDTRSWQRPDADRARALANRSEAASVPCLHRRREASRRLPALACGHRDPLDCLADEGPFVVGPCRYGLTEEQARRHANHLVASGWSVDEVVKTVGVEPRAA